jgi:hypothetical protein
MNCCFFFFFLDEKEAKNQACRKMAKIYFLSLQGTSLKPSISSVLNECVFQLLVIYRWCSLLNAPVRKFLNAIFLRAVITIFATMLFDFHSGQIS